MLCRDCDLANLGMLFPFADDLHAVASLKWLFVSFCIAIWSSRLELVYYLWCAIITPWNTERLCCLGLNFSFMEGYS